MLPTCLILAQGQEPLRNQSQLGKELVSCLARCYVCNKKRVGNTAPNIHVTYALSRCTHAGKMSASMILHMQ